MKSLFVSDEKTTLLKKGFNALLVISILIGIFYVSLTIVGVTFSFDFIITYKQRIVTGFGTTLLISLMSMVLSLIIGIVSAIGQESKLLPFKILSKIYVGFIRGTPLIVQIYLFYYIVGTAWGINNRMTAGVLILSIFEGAYISEIIRGSLSSIESAQLEAAKSVGFTSRQTVRYVIVPQLFTRTLPALTGQFASIIKDSSLLSIIALIEITQTFREISATNLRLFEAYFVLGILYLALTLPITLLSQWLERTYAYEH